MGWFEGSVERLVWRWEGSARWKARGCWRAAAMVLMTELSGRGFSSVTRRPIPVVRELDGCGVIGLRVCGRVALCECQVVTMLCKDIIRSTTYGWNPELCCVVSFWKSWSAYFKPPASVSCMPAGVDGGCCESGGEASPLAMSASQSPRPPSAASTAVCGQYTWVDVSGELRRRRVCGIH